MSTAALVPINDPLAVGIEILMLEFEEMLAAEDSLAEFVRQGWHVVEPGTTFMDNWHIDAICGELEATVPWNGEPPLIQQMVITIPPRCMKTIIVSVFFPAWVWIHMPHLRFLYSSYAESLSSEHSEACRTLVESDWYQNRWGDRVQLKKGDNLKTRFSNTARGRRQATSVGAKTTGLGGDFVIVDDPHNVLETESETVREKAVRWWTKAMSTRLNNPKTGVRIIIQQRVHEVDVAGVAIASGDYVHLNLPMEYEPTNYVSPTGWSDPRTVPGELLWTERMDDRFIAKKKVELGSYAYAAQMQQRPTPAEGGIIKRHWWGQYRVRPEKILGTLQSWDTGFKDGKNNDYSVCTTWAYTRRDRFLLDVFRERLEFPDLERMFVQQYNRWRPDVVLIEDKASGQSLYQKARRGLGGGIRVIAIPVPKDQDKPARVHDIAPIFESGAVLLPESAPWLDEYQDEWKAFPLGAHDDQVDSTAQAIKWMDGRTGDSGGWSTTYLPDEEDDDLDRRRQ